MMSRILMLCLLISFGALSAVTSQLSSNSVGVCNGRVGNNLPSEEETVALYRANGIKKMRIYDPNQRTLAALRDSGIELILDVPNVELASLQSDATPWVRANVLPYFPNTRIRIIAVGNEVNPEKSDTARFVPLVLPAMRSIYRALSSFNLQGQIKVSTATYSALLQDTYPPSRTSFKHASNFMNPIVDYLGQIGSPLLVNIYPYFAYIGDRTGSIKLDFALLASQRVEYEDRGLQYRNLFDAMVDGVYYALEKAGRPGVEVVVSETGWPSAGGANRGAETVANAGTYYRNLIRHVSRGTPKKSGALQTYLFAMFDENTKPGERTEQHFGLFNPNSRTTKYQL